MSAPLQHVRIRHLVAAVAIAGMAHAGDAPAAAPPREWLGGAPLSSWSHLTGDWGGLRTDLADRGIAFDAYLTNEVSDVLRAGADDGSAEHPRRLGQRSQVGLGLSLDLEKLVGIPKADARVRFWYAGGDAAANRVGDAQGWSNLSVDDDIHEVCEAWYQQRFGAVPGGGDGDFIRIKAGKVDANTEFDTLPALALFLNSSAGFSPTFFAIPTYPDPATSVNLFVQPVAPVTLGLGYYDASATTRGAKTGELGAATFFAHDARHDKLWVGQIAGRWNGGSAQLGGWWLGGDLVGSDGSERSHTTGWYALAQQDLWSGSEHQTITAVAQAAGADDRFSDYGLHLAAGLWAQHVIPGRPADACGVYVTDVRFTDATDAAGERVFAAAHETAYEAVYALQATGWWLLRGDVQCIRHPGGSLDPQSAVVVALRSDITF